MSNLLDNLTDLVGNYLKEVDTDKLKRDSLELEQEFQEKYPLSKIQSMTLEEYALGREENPYSFCWWLEYHSRVLGSIKGGSAKKHVIFFKKTGEWYYPEKFEHVEQAWQQLRADYVELIENTVNGEAIESNNLLFSANMLKTKIAYLFYPEKYLPIYSITDIRFFLEELQVSEELWKPIRNDSIALNHLLKTEIDKLDAFTNWHPVVTMRFFYYTLKREQKYVKIAPGDNARLWEQCKEEGNIRIGWDQLGDFAKYADHAELKKGFQEKTDLSKGKATEKSGEAWSFYSLEPGDQIIVNKGTKLIIGKGTVTAEGYTYREDLSEYKHTVSVDWDKDFEPIHIPAQKKWAFQTVATVKEKQVQKWFENSGDTNSERMSQSDLQTGDQSMEFTDKEELEFNRIKKVLERKGQCILYGPPGTGKTYTARRFVEWSLQEQGKVGQHEKVMKLVTFHPSYTYEDFMEGFKPVSTKEGTVHFKLEEGLFKQFCLEAAQNIEVPHYFIIDELNRGNVPKIFGELITLLEKDKRGVTVELPQSKDPFSIPNNVYIIATMNTSDRSIKMMDAALKRRFAFIECLPSYDLLDQVIDELGESPAKILRTVNKRLIEKGGRDLQVGHSYFMKAGEQITSLEELKEVLEFELIPLLQEYCHDNYEDLAELIGEDFINLEELLIRETIFTDQDDSFTTAINALIKG